MPGTTTAGAHRRDDLVQCITDFHAAYGYAPSVRDLARQIGCAYSTVAHHLGVLEAAGAITRDKRVARSLRVVTQ